MLSITLYSFFFKIENIIQTLPPGLTGVYVLPKDITLEDRCKIIAVANKIIGLHHKILAKLSLYESWFSEGEPSETPEQNIELTLLIKTDENYYRV